MLLTWMLTNRVTFHSSLHLPCIFPSSRPIQQWLLDTYTTGPTQNRIRSLGGHASQRHKPYDKVSFCFSIKEEIYLTMTVLTRPICSTMVHTSKKRARESSSASETPCEVWTKLSTFEERYNTATKSNEEVLSKYRPLTYYFNNFDT